MRPRVFAVRLGGGGSDWTPQTMLLRFVVHAFGLLLASALVPGITIGDWQSWVAGTAIFGIVNLVLRPLAYFVSCCLVVATFGLFSIVINAALLALTAWAAGQLELDFVVEDFLSAVLGALVISLASLAAGVFVRRPSRRA